MSPETTSVPAYGDLGFTPDGGLAWSLPRVVGAARAADVLLTGEALDRTRAYAIGLVARVAEEARIEGVADDIARRLAARPRGGVRGTKTLLCAGASRGLRISWRPRQPDHHSRG